MNIGNKSRGLNIIKDKCLVPRFFTVNLYESLDIKQDIIEILNNNDLNEVYEKVKGLIQAKRGNLKIDVSVSAQTYAVRSSSNCEDTASLSLAGIFDTYLDITLGDLPDKIIECFLSLYKYEVLQMLVDNSISIENAQMEVIVQEMIVAQYNGVFFGLNPLNGNDKEVVIEINESQDGTVVSGQNPPKKIIYNYFLETFQTLELNHKPMLLDIISKCLELQAFLGFPTDIEFLYTDKLYILQVRPITRINFNYDCHYTRANFKDGGVSASLTTPLMASLYEYTFDNALKDFLVKTKALKEGELNKEIIIFGSRCYWNVTDCKRASLKLPGFIEREYDLELGIPIKYTGEGQTPKYSIAFFLKAARIAFAVSKIFKRNKLEYQKLIDENRGNYQKLNSIDLIELTDVELFSAYQELIKLYYYKAEHDYFTQVFINIERLALYRKYALKSLSRGEYLRTLSSIEKLSHFKLEIQIDEIADSIIRNNLSEEFLETDNITLWSKISNLEVGAKIQKVNQEFAYLSNKVLDITYENYGENITYIIDVIKLRLSNDHKKEIKNKLEYLEVSNKISISRFKKIHKKANAIKLFLWLREELKEVSSMFYHLIRKYTLEVEGRLISSDILQKGDIFFCQFDIMIAFLNNEISKQELRRIIKLNKTYYASFSNFEPIDDIGFDNKKTKLNGNSLVGIGASAGISMGKAKVFESLLDVKNVHNIDIIVVKHLEPGMFPYLKNIKGIVSETGGVLCHTSIMARELAIPLVISLHDATKLIKDGDLIMIDGESGQVFLK